MLWNSPQWIVWLESIHSSNERKLSFLLASGLDAHLVLAWIPYFLEQISILYFSLLFKVPCAQISGHSIQRYNLRPLISIKLALKIFQVKKKKCLIWKKKKNQLNNFQSPVHQIPHSISTSSKYVKLFKMRTRVSNLITISICATNFACKAYCTNSDNV